VEQHVQECSECAKELESLKGVLQVLEPYAEEIFCPEADELYLFARSDRDPKGFIARHIKQCPLCSHEVSKYRAACSESPEMEPLPDVVRAAFGRVQRDRNTTRQPARGKLSDLLFGVVRRPVLALGTAAVVVLLLVVVYPLREPTSKILLSSVAWSPPGRPESVAGVPGTGRSNSSLYDRERARQSLEEVLSGAAVESTTRLGKKASPDERPGGRLPHLPEKPLPVTGPFTGSGIETPRPRIAFLIQSVGPKDPLSQKRIDELYDALKPAPRFSRLFDVLPPGEVKRLFPDPKAVPQDVYQLAGRLHKDLGVSKLAIVSLISQEGQLKLRTELINAESGTTISESSLREVEQANLPLRVSESLYLLLNPQSVPRAP